MNAAVISKGTAVRVSLVDTVHSPGAEVIAVKTSANLRSVAGKRRSPAVIPLPVAVGISAFRKSFVYIGETDKSPAEVCIISIAAYVPRGALYQIGEFGW